jgi:hypothetical protein
MFKSHNFALAGASIAVSLTVLSTAAPRAQAATLTYSETTTGAPTWIRPTAGNPPTTTANNLNQNAIPYSVLEFSVGTAGNYDFTSTVAPTTPFNNFTALYRNSFNSTTPLANIIIANNNKGGVVGVSGFNNVALATNTNYFFVTTGSNNSNFGNFTNTISGQGSVTAAAVPEPATILGTLAAFGYGVYTKRKMKLAQSSEKETV